MGCSSSIPGYRGYPCSLWQLFHVVMTQYARTAPDMDHHLVLSAMRGYISNFFTCTECQGNWKIATENYKAEVESAQDAVLYLWQRHNIVNYRLKSEGKEDPEYPKIQWPSADMCDECVTGVANDAPIYNKSKVYEFLLNFYHGDNIEPIPVVEEPEEPEETEEEPKTEENVEGEPTESKIMDEDEQRKAQEAEELRVLRELKKMKEAAEATDESVRDEL